MRTAVLVAVFWIASAVTGAVLDALVVARPFCGFFDPVPCSRLQYLAEHSFMWMLYPVYILAGPLTFIRQGRLVLVVGLATAAAAALTYALSRRWKKPGVR